MAWVLNDFQKRDRRKALARRFATLDLSDFEWHYRTRNGHGPEATLATLRLAKTGDYYVAEIARALNKRSNTISMILRRAAAFQRTTKKRAHNIRSDVKLICSPDGTWRLAVEPEREHSGLLTG